MNKIWQFLWFADYDFFVMMLYLPHFYCLVVLIDWCSSSNLKADALTWERRISSAVRQQQHNTIMVSMQNIMQFRSHEFNQFWCSSLECCLRFTPHPFLKGKLSPFLKKPLNSKAVSCTIRGIADLCSTNDWFVFISYRIHAI